SRAEWAVRRAHGPTCQAIRRILGHPQSCLASLASSNKTAILEVVLIFCARWGPTMATKSHVDMCLFFQILEVSEDRIPPTLVGPLLSRDNEEIGRALTQLQTDSPTRLRDIFVDDETNLHESIHVVQAVIYPFLRWYSLFMYQYVMDTFKELDQTVDIFNRLEVTSAVSPVFSLLDFECIIYDATRKCLWWNYKPA